MADREAVTNALRFWETGRLYYNLVLLFAVSGLIWVIARDVGATLLDLWPTLLFFALIANVLYCAAYPVDLLVQSSDFQMTWRKWRWVLWAAGMALALVSALLVTGGMTLFDLGPGD